MGSFYMALLALLATTVLAIDNDMRKSKRAIGIFNVVKFPNDACDSNAAGMNGTCYTAEECASKDGTASGECAEGYGVCCVLTVACGATTTENGTYLSQADSTSPATDSDTSLSCTYTICPRTASVSRIRLDLQTFSIAGPSAVATTGEATGVTATMGNSIGQCVTDLFSVTGAPVICGTNTGQHMIVDTDGSSCVTASFSYGGAATQSRSYTIQVTQFESSNEMGGPAGCFQFYTGLTGTVNSFNWNGVAASTHLANQNYNVCVRQAIDRCYICWSPIETGQNAATAARGTFGVSNAGSMDGAAKGGVGASCPVAAASVIGAGPGDGDSDDFIIIPAGQSEANAKNFGAVSAGNDKYCGRYLADTTDSVADGSVCSRSAPFMLGVNFDAFEAVDAGAVANEQGQEASGTAASAGPLGTMGFSLGFTQATC